MFWILISLLKESSFFPSLVALKILWKLARGEETLRVFFKIEKKIKRKDHRKITDSKVLRLKKACICGILFGFVFHTYIIRYFLLEIS